VKSENRKGGKGVIMAINLRCFLVTGLGISFEVLSEHETRNLCSLIVISKCKCFMHT
jgi:hypothetical protein